MWWADAQDGETENEVMDAASTKEENILVALAGSPAYPQAVHDSKYSLKCVECDKGFSYCKSFQKHQSKRSKK